MFYGEKRNLDFKRGNILYKFIVLLVNLLDLNCYYKNKKKRRNENLNIYNKCDSLVFVINFGY